MGFGDNDVTPLIEAGKKHLKGFLDFKYPNWLFCPSCPYKFAQIVVKHEYWQQYLDLAISIVYESKDMDEFNEKMIRLNNTFPAEWYDEDIVL